MRCLLDKKRCSKCKKKLPLTKEFWFKESRSKEGVFRTECKDCSKAINKIGYERRKSTDKFTYERYIKSMYTKHRTTEQDIRDLMDVQKGCCDICGSSLNNPCFSNLDMHIDHCHTTGKVRGLLCSNCNTGLGMFQDNPTLLYNAINYLSRRLNE